MAEQHDVAGQVRWPRRQMARAEEIWRLQVIRRVTHLGWDAPPGIGFDAEAAAIVNSASSFALRNVGRPG